VHRTARIGAATLVTALTVTSWATPALAAARSAAHPHYRSHTTTAQAAAGYLVGRLVGHHHNHLDESYVDNGTTVSYPAYGEDADTVLSLDAAGTAQSAAGRVTSYLEKHVTGYIGTSPHFSPGAIGKLLLVAAAQHVDARSFGGQDLVKDLTGTEGASGAAAGEFQQGSFASTTSDALAVLGLADTRNASGQPDAAAVHYLASRQCTDGGFPSEISGTTAASCAAGSDVDSTGYAVQALFAVQSKPAARSGLSFLRHARHGNGGFGSGGTSNANSTAIAVEALVAAHAGVTKAVGWLQGRQLGCSAGRSRRGAVRFESSYDSSAQLATSQAGVALARASLATVDRGGAHRATPTLSCIRT
jgi:hypothetical protein